MVRPKLIFTEVLDKYGYPVVSKEVAQVIRGYRSKPDGCRAEQLGFIEKTGKYGKRYDFSRYKYLVDMPFKISDACCDVMKKSPAHAYTKRTGLYPILATMVTESSLRRTKWIRHGCNAFNLKNPNSAPMSFWTEQDVLQYIKLKNIPIASVYGDIIEDNGKYKTTGVNRTGCIFCMFGIMSEKQPNKFQRMKITHPKQYEYCMNKLGLKEVLTYLGVPYE